MLDESTHLDRKAATIFFTAPVSEGLGNIESSPGKLKNTSVISKLCRVNFLKHMKVSMRFKNKPSNSELNYSSIYPFDIQTPRERERERRREKEGKMKERKTRQKNKGKEKRKEGRK